MSTRAYKKQHYDTIRFWVQPETKQIILSLAAQNGVTISQLLVEAVEDVYNCNLLTRTTGAGKE